MRSSLIWYFVLASPNTYLLHQELLNFMLIAMSTQLLSGPKPGQNDVHPFLGAAMDQVTIGNDPIFNMNLVYCCCWLDRSCYIYIYIYICRKVLWLVQLSVNCYLITWCDPNSQMACLIPYILKEINLVFCKGLVLQLVCLLEFNWSGYSFSLIFSHMKWLLCKLQASINVPLCGSVSDILTDWAHENIKYALN